MKLLNFLIYCFLILIETILFTVDFEFNKTNILFILFFAILLTLLLPILRGSDDE